MSDSELQIQVLKFQGRNNLILGKDNLGCATEISQAS